MRRLIVALGCFALLLGTAACSDDARDEARETAEDVAEEVREGAEEAADRAEDVVNDRNVEIEDFAYKPATRTIKVATEITWINRDSVDHTVTAKEGSFDGQLNGEGEEFSFRFTQSGEFDYYCEIHGEDRMSGTVIVE